ncbi:unnamed protein product [Chilo suppressalis]|uniref:Elongation of very long chain fatty acids protein n=1 Tax=Chilo suppressalis TaxID=168631 RepID=A0ABN8BC42_CHISP|nr:unnamed protein product [Chilo suppressalis]
MSFSLGKNPAWDLNKSAYSELDSMPLMQSPGPVLMILAGYLLIILKIGPAFMRKREAFKLTKTLAFYNALQVVLSAYLFQMYFFAIARMGVVPKACYMNQDKTRKEILNYIWWYFAAKLTELLDTVFFILRKKDNQVTFLHLYHHSIMMTGTWLVLKYCPSHTLIFIGMTNSLVHVVMYTYYGLAAFGPKFQKYLKWKKYITTMQLIQFVSIIIQYVLSVKLSECPPSKGVATAIASNTVFFLLLFLNFYRQSYRKNKRQAENKLTEKASTVKTVTENLPQEHLKVN